MSINTRAAMNGLKIGERYKLSIIIPIYKVEEYIEKCVETLFEQTLDNIEYIFVDDNSPDKSISKIRKLLLEKYPSKERYVKFIRNSENLGPACARNIGLNVASGDFIAFCDADDYVNIQMYEMMYDTAFQTEADIVYCDFYEVNNDKDFKIRKTVAVNPNKNAFLQSYLNSWTVIWNMIVKRELFVKYKLKFPDGISYREDLYLTLMLYYYAKSIQKIEKPLYYYNKLNSSSLLTVKSDKVFHDVISCDLKIIDFLKGENILHMFEQTMAWIVLRDKQDLVLDIKKHKDFLLIYPSSHAYILECPFLNLKIKLMMWFLTHHMRYLTVLAVRLRTMLGKNGK